METNFFETDCQEPSRTNALFGICDDKNEEKAYTNIVDSSKWIATVKNDTQISIVFTAIDNCLNFKKEDTNDLESTCDGMLTFKETIYLVELKDKKKKWISEGIGQLENTIKIMLDNDDLKEFKYKKAFICNKKKKFPRFNTITNERDKLFFDKNGFILHVKAIIEIK